MTEQNIRDAFELHWDSTMNTIEMDLHRFGGGYACHETNRGWISFKAGWIAAFKMILESEVDG